MYIIYVHVYTHMIANTHMYLSLSLSLFIYRQFWVLVSCQHQGGIRFTKKQPAHKQGNRCMEHTCSDKKRLQS